MQKRFRLSAAILSALPCAAAFGFNITGDSTCRISYVGDRTVITCPQSTTLNVTGSGTAEVLLVGGGGGSGAINVYGCAGGGAGGVVYTNGLQLAAGDFPVTVGAGGAGGTGTADGKASNGGNTVAFDITAYGGGAGATRPNNKSGKGADGASGGGSTLTWTPNAGSSGTAGGLAIHGDQGHDGGLAPHAMRPGDGGGAGEAAKLNTTLISGSYGGGYGGDGLPFDITGTETYYGGGGSGICVDEKGKLYVDNTHGGNGGGGNNCAGMDGLGGGGSGGYAGGSGVVIVSFVATQDEPVTTDDFDVAGGDRSVNVPDGKTLVFNQAGTLTVTGEGEADILIVGGGGGGGFAANYGAAGGGGGGVVTRMKHHLVPGTYAIAVGAGGAGGTAETPVEMAVGKSGGDSSFAGLIAYGGGGGAGRPGNKGGHGGDGASGGGSTIEWSTLNRNPGKAIWGDQGHDGGAADFAYRPGGGGGAGAAATAAPTPFVVSATEKRGGGCGGDGRWIDIAGATDWYGGGGAGYAFVSGGASYESYTHGGKGGGGNKSAGTEGLGGGGSGGGFAGGRGIVVVRMYSKPSAAEPLDTLAEGGVVVSGGAGYKSHCFTSDGTFTLPQDATVDILLVGGGGGSGAVSNPDENGNCYGGAGGGGGGVVYLTNVRLAAGSYPITIGQGGVGGLTTASKWGANGGETKAFGVVAYGGGGGAVRSNNIGNSGATGGGSCVTWTDTRTGGRAIYGDQGFDGGSADHAVRPGGGGGAGGPAMPCAKRYDGMYGGGYGGDGRQIPITKANLYYGGGGAGFSAEINEGKGVYKTYKEQSHGGNGGGGNNSKGEDGLGGGGSGGYGGGSGTVIVRYRYDSGMAIILR